MQSSDTTDPALTVYNDFDALVAADMDSLDGGGANPPWREPQSPSHYANSHPQSVFESAMDDEGNMVPDEYSYTDGGKADFDDL
ncbi:uncharacterized protein BDV14DRAFT_206332 [Aspergillus stella-maris]|uniref:uncharacterized protein n=1 Tax=Aspergillus stella-maris TaxID=1810926 RepID=UPI003CCD7E79